MAKNDSKNVKNSFDLSTDSEEYERWLTNKANEFDRAFKNHDRKLLLDCCYGKEREKK